MKLVVEKHLPFFLQFFHLLYLDLYNNHGQYFFLIFTFFDLDFPSEFIVVQFIDELFHLQKVIDFTRRSKNCYRLFYD